MPVLRFLVKRTGLGLLMVVATSFIGFVFMSTLTTNVAFNLLGATATDEQISAKEAELGLDQPLFGRYLDWAGNVLQGDFGRSWFTSQSVTDALISRLPVTLSIAVGAILLALVIAVVAGVIAGVKRGRIDR